MCAATCTACDVVDEITYPFDTNAYHDRCPFGQVIMWIRACVLNSQVETLWAKHPERMDLSE